MAEGSERLWLGSMPEAYERYLGGAVFEPFAADLARRVAARRPPRVLELAAGTGILTRQLVGALEAAAEVTATDLNEAMVEFGRQQVPGAAWRQADALDLPFDDGAFDAVACQFGVMFFPDRPAAFAEARRVLRPDGALFVNVWAGVEQHDFAAALVAGVARAFPDDPPAFIVSIPHGYADPDRIAADLAAGSLTCRSLETVTLEGRAASAADVAAGFCTGTPLRAEIEARGDLPDATAVIGGEMERRLGSGEVTGRMTAYVVEAVPAAGRP